MTRTILPIVLLAIWVLAGSNLATTPPNLERALIVQQERVSSDPRDPVAWNDFGNLLVLAERYAEAEEAYRQALDLTPDHLSARFNLALLLQQTGRQRDAEVELERLLELDPRHAWGHYQLGIVLAARQERRAALDHYARALAYDPSLTFAENNPHIIDNPLFSEALLLSQRYGEPPGARVPRQYGEPDRIVELLLRQPKEAETDEEGVDEEDVGEGVDEAGAASPGGALRRKPEDDPRAAPGESEPARRQPRSGAGQAQQDQPPQQTVPGVVVVPQTPPASVSQSPGGRRLVGPQTAPPPSRAVPPGTRAPDPRARTSAEPEASSQDRPTLREASPPPSRRSSRYIPPSRRSTGQLEFKLLPEEEPPIRVARIND